MSDNIRKLRKESLEERPCWKRYNKAMEKKSNLMHRIGKKYHLYGSCYLNYREHIEDIRYSKVVLEVNMHCYKEDSQEIILVHSLTSNLSKYFKYNDEARDYELHRHLEFLCSKMLELLRKGKLDQYIYGGDSNTNKSVSDTHYNKSLKLFKRRGKRSTT